MTTSKWWAPDQEEEFLGNAHVSGTGSASPTYGGETEHGKKAESRRVPVGFRAPQDERPALREALRVWGECEWTARDLL